MSEIAGLTLVAENVNRPQIDPSGESSGNATTTSMPTITLASELRATTGTCNTAELLEQILSYLPAAQLLRAKATCRNFHNAICASPTLRKETSTFLRLKAVDEADLFKTDAGGDVVFPTKDLEPLAFFYPEDGEKRLFVRFMVTKGRFEVLRDSNGFMGLFVVDQSVSAAVVGWHCGCFAGLRAEAELGAESGKVTFGDMLEAMERRHADEGHKDCRGVSKFWLDGLWTRSKEMRELGC